MTWRRLRWSLAITAVVVEAALFVWQVTRRKRRMSDRA